MSTPKMKLPEWAAGQNQPWTSVNDALRRLDVIGQLSVISDSLATPPVAPADGDCYIVAAAATGAWAGWEGQLAAWIANVWVKITPREGWSAWVQSASQNFTYQSGAWVALIKDAPSDGAAYARKDGAWVAVSTAGGMYDMDVMFAGTPAASQVIFSRLLGRNVEFPVDFAGSYGKIGTNPTAPFALDVRADGVTIGTISISTGGTITFASTGGTPPFVRAGVEIEVVAPAVVDPTAADISIAIVGSSDGGVYAPLGLVNSYGSGEIGDVWIYDAANTDAINLGDAITSATGLVNANVQNSGAGAPALVDDGGTLGGQFARLGATASPYGDFLKWAIGSTISQPATIGISINSSETGAMVAVTGSSAASRMQISTTGAGDLVSYAGVTLDSTINAPLGRRTVVVEFDGVSTKMYVDGVLLATGDAGSQGTDTLTIGALWDRTYGINGIVHASFFIDRLMVDAAELDRFHQFLASPTAAAVTG